MTAPTDDEERPTLLTILFWVIACGFGFWFPAYTIIKDAIDAAN